MEPLLPETGLLQILTGIGFFVILFSVSAVRTRRKRTRIRNYIKARGGQVIKISASQYGSDQRDAYKVAYTDQTGAYRTTHCMFGAGPKEPLFWTHRPMESVPTHPTPQAAPDAYAQTHLEHDTARAN